MAGKSGAIAFEYPDDHFLGKPVLQVSERTEEVRRALGACLR